MQPVIPSDITSAAVQLVIYFVTAVGVFVSFVLTARV